MFGIPKALAHVRYVAPSDPGVMGVDAAFLAQPLSDPINIAIGISVAVVAVIAAIVIYKVPALRRELSTIRSRADSYHDLIPWMLRLSAGIALIGSGTTQTLITPVLEGYTYLAFFQVLLGFLLLTGFLVVPASAAAIALYIVAVTKDFYIIGNLDFLAVVVSLLIIDNERPGVDDIVDMPKLSPYTMCKRYVPVILRVGVGGAMFFLGIYEKILNPHMSEYVVHAYDLTSIVPVSAATWVVGAGVVECLIGLALIVGIRTRFMSTIAFVVLSLSFFYFTEDVASHITLFGALSVLFVTRGGPLSVDKKLGVVNPHFT